MVTVAGEPVVDAQTLQRRMFGEATDVPLPITTFRNGAMVDVIAQPVELRDDADRWTYEDHPEAARRGGWSNSSSRILISAREAESKAHRSEPSAREAG
jgi:hypothetical protein